MKIKSDREGEWDSLEDYLCNQLPQSITRDYYSDDTHHVITELIDSVTKSNIILTKLLEDLPIDKINKYLGTNFEEVE